MNKLKLIFSIIALMICSLVTKAQPPFVERKIMVTYAGHILAPGTLRVSSGTGATNDFSSGSSYAYSSSSSMFTLDWSHAFYPGWGSRIVVINKSTFDSMPYGSATYFYKGSMFYYEVTKGYGYSVVGTTYDYTLSIRVYEPSL